MNNEMILVKLDRKSEFFSSHSFVAVTKYDHSWARSLGDYYVGERPLKPEIYRNSPLLLLILLFPLAALERISAIHVLYC